MKKIITLLAFLMIVSGNLFAQYSTDWIRPADNYMKTGVMMARDNADNVIVTGYVTSNNIFTRKYDKFGNFQWEKVSTSGIQSNYEKSMWVNTDNNNNVFVTGFRYVGTSQQYPNAIVVLKYNAAGTLLWKKTIPMTIFVNTWIGFNLRSEVDANGNLYIGTVAVTPSGFVLLKLDPNGTTLFTSSNNLNSVTMFRSMRLKGNKVVFSGSSANLSAAPVVAWDTSGNLLWTASFLGQSGNDIEIDDAGNTYMLTSYANQVSATSGQDILIYKLNSAGTQVWRKDFDFGGYDFPTRFTFVADKLSVIGYGSINASYFDWITFQINTSGTMIWNARYNETTGNDEQCYFLSAKANGEVFVTGKGGPMITQVNGSSYLRMITLKYSNTGVVKWVDSLNIYSGWGIASTLASDNSLYVLSDRYMTAFHFLDHSGTGICTIPTGLNVSNIVNTSATFSWTPVPGASLYRLRYKTTSAAAWTVTSINIPSITLTNLTAGTAYNYAVEAICSSGPSGYSTTQTFTTTGTGYCTTGGQSTAQEFLNLVWIGGITNLTMSNNGYADFTNLSTPVTQGSLVYGYLMGATTPYGLMENYSIWIDYNHDNDFTDAGEQVVNISSDFGGYIGVNFTVPGNAVPGPARMRVTIINGTPPTPCGLYARGETEDYTVVINEMAVPTCTDGIQNGNETGIDCGGSCPPCPTCTDGIQNGNETGIDCGGSCPVCPTCTDGIQNGNETGIDCGGSCPACPTGCNFVLLNSNNFESGWGIWNNGGTDCNRISQATYANSGTYSIQLRDNTSSSVMTTNNMNLAQYQKIKIKFSYITVSMDNSNEDFWLQVSTNGGSTYTTAAEWNLNDEFVNNQRYFDSVVLEQTFTSTTRFRFRCDASDDNDWVYLDDVVISGCPGSTARIRLQAETVNVGENGTLGIFPNPVDDILYIKGISIDNRSNQIIEIYDVTGKRIMTNNISGNSVNVSSLKTGIYFIRISQKSVSLYSGRFIKK